MMIMLIMMMMMIHLQKEEEAEVSGGSAGDLNLKKHLFNVFLELFPNAHFYFEKQILNNNRN